MRKEKRHDQIATIVFYGIAILISFILLAMVGFMIKRGFSGLSWHFLTAESENLKAGGGIGPQIWNSFYLLLITMLISVPIGIGGGIYMAEYASDNWFTQMVRLSIEVLSSLPSIVVGLFGLLFLVQKLGLGFSIGAGAITLTIFNLPLLVRITEQAIRNVPLSQKSASLAMGVTHWDTIRYILLPGAMGNIVTGMILAAGRVFGEAAALMYTAGMSSSAVNGNNMFSLTRPGETLAVHIWKINAEGLSPDAAQIVASASLVLVMIVFSFNVLARFLGKCIYKKFAGKMS